MRHNVLLLSLLTSAAVSGMLQEVKFHVDTNVNGTEAPAHYESPTEGSSKSVIKCSNLCISRNLCFGFVYGRTLGRCRLFTFGAYFGSWVASDLMQPAVFVRQMGNIPLHLDNCSQSTTYSPSKSTCDKAIDGVTLQDYSLGFCSQTSCKFNRTEEWWRASFPAPSFVTHLIIYNRMDCCPQRLNIFTIQLDGVACFHRNETSSFSVGNFTCGKFGREFAVLNAVSECLSFCEILAFGFHFP